MLTKNEFDRLEQEEARLIALYLDSDDDAAEADAILEKIAVVQVVMMTIDIRRDTPC